MAGRAHAKLRTDVQRVTRIARLATAFTRVGIFSFGGGHSVIPLIQRENQRHGWLEQERFVDALAFGNALPGPIATNLAGYLGYRAAGWAGAVVAVLAVALPTVLAMVLLGSLFLRYQHLEAVQRLLAGVRPVVVALVALVVIQFLPATFGARSAWRRNAGLWLWAICAFVLLRVLGFHPAIVILSGGLLGLTLLRDPR